MCMFFHSEPFDREHFSYQISAMNKLSLSVAMGILCLTGLASAQSPAPELAAYTEQFSQSKSVPCDEVKLALAGVTSQEPRKIAAIIEAAAAVWPAQLKTVLACASEAHPLWAPLMTAAAVGQQPGEVNGLREAALAGLAKAAGRNPSSKVVIDGKGVVGKEVVPGKTPIPDALDPEDDRFGNGWMNLSPSQYAALVQAVNVAAATALRNGPVNAWLWDAAIDTTAIKKAIRLVLDPLVNVPIQIPAPEGEQEVVTPIN